MRTLFLSSLVLIASALVAPHASADALPDCPAGTHLVENPVDPGAMHHNGGECVEDEGGGGGCAVSPRRSTSPALGFLFAAACVWRRVSRR